jgi:hypothetical protein
MGAPLGFGLSHVTLAWKETLHMKPPGKIFSIINSSLCAFLCLLGFLTFLTNYFDLWQAWHYAAAAFLLLVPIVAVFQIVVLIDSLTPPSKKRILWNGATLLVSAVVIWVYFAFLTTWF